MSPRQDNVRIPPARCYGSYSPSVTRPAILTFHPSRKTDRAQKLKAAKTDAQTEIEAYKATKAAELKSFQDEFAGANVQLESNAEKEVQVELEKIRKTALEKKDIVSKLLIDTISSPKPELHANVAH